MFGEKSEEYSAKQGKKIPVWVSPKYEQSKEKALEIIAKYDTIKEGDFWILMNETKSGKMAYTGLIISHNACLKINDALPEKDKFDPDCVSVDKDGFNDSLIYTYQNKKQGIYEVGEVSKSNCKNAYPYAMAFKRCFDRVVLKISKIAFDGIYSDSEADEFKEPADEKRKDTGLTQEEAKKRIMEREEWKKKVMEVASEKGIGFKELANDYDLNKKTTAEDFKKVYEDLKGE